MRNIHKLLFLPLLAALAISCSSPTSLQTSEYDDVYYSKKDQTIIADVVPAATAATASGPTRSAEEAGVANPEYAPKNSGGYTADTGTDYYSPDFYDEDDYYYASRIRRFNAPYRGLSYYDFAYTDYYWYNRNPMYYGRSIYHDPFNSCYTCYGYPAFYGGVNIFIGRPYYSRWGNPWGYSGYGYDGYGYGRYGGYGGYSGYNANSGWYRNDNTLSRNVQYGPRRDRSAIPGGDSRIAPNRPRTDVGGTVSGGGGVVRPEESGMRTNRSTRGRVENAPSDGGSQPIAPRSGTRGRVDRSNEGVPADRSVEPANTRRPTRGGTRELDTTPTPQIQPRSTEEAPASPSRSRRGIAPRPSEDRPVYQPRQEQPRQEQPRQEQPRQEPRYQPRQRTEESRPQPTYEAPQRQQRYSPPSSTPSYSPPSRSSGGGGGSSDGGSRSTRGRGN